LEKNRHIKRPEKSFPSVTSGIDRVIKKHFDEHRKNGTKPKELLSDHSTIPKEISLFPDLELVDKFRRKIEWKDDKGNELFGKIDDLLFDEEGDAIVIDFKTKGDEPKEEAMSIDKHYRPQLEAYAFLLKKNGLNVKNFGYLLYFYPKKINDNKEAEFEFEIRTKKIDLNPSNVEKTFYDAIETLKAKPPDSSPGCQYCEWVYKRKKEGFI